MPYLQPADYELFGLPADLAEAWVAQATALMDAHCRRPTLLATQYVERLRLAPGVQTARLSYGPLAAGAVTAVRVRYSRPRRADAGEAGFGYATGPAGFAQPWQAEAAMLFGLPGTWTTLAPAAVDLDLAARELLFPANLLGLPYNEAEVTYTAGLATVPPQVKAACAQVIRNAMAVPALNVRSSRVDTLQVDYWSGSLLDPGVAAMLRPYLAEKLG